MSSEEEKQAIEFFEKRKNICLENANICDENDYDGEAEYLREEKMYIDTVLNIIAKLQKENEEKDKQIDLMANYIVNLIKYNNPEEIREVEEIKQYFERKVEDVKD